MEPAASKIPNHGHLIFLPEASNLDPRLPVVKKQVTVAFRILRERFMKNRQRRKWLAIATHTV
jgi:hypothetical protein